MNQKDFEHIQKINSHWKEVFSSLFVLNKVDSSKFNDFIVPYIAQLALLPVSKKNVFRDMTWDFNGETKNRAASVKNSHVQLKFGDYKHIPLGVITELKCLFLYVYATPQDFGHRKNEIKPNTLIGIFSDGLSFLNFVFSEMETRLGNEYVHDQCGKFSEITLLDFEESARKTSLKLHNDNRPNTQYKYFFSYLNAHKTKIDIGIECQADFNAIKNAYVKEHKKIYEPKEDTLSYLETEIFDLALRKASFNVVSFLYAIGEKVNDSIMAKHYEMLAVKYEEFLYSKQDFEDYGAYRLSRRGYSFDYINAVFPDNQVTKFSSNANATPSMVEYKFRQLFESSEPLRVAFNDIYYSALWIIGSLMGARPNVYSDLKINSCLDLEDGTIIGEEHKGRDNRWNLFNDCWVVIPIMIDAIKAVELIGGKLLQNMYVFGNSVTSNPDEEQKPRSGLTSTVEYCIQMLTGIDPNDVITKMSGYLFRHSLAYQMYRADVGLPVITYQLKHVVSAVENLARSGKVSQTTLGYGGIANQLVSKAAEGIKIRHYAEIESVKANFNPNSKYMGGMADEHLSKIKKFFNGCMEAGYTEEEIYEAMVEQGLAIINVGTGFCFGGVEDFDDTLPCIGGLRCNPIRCRNAVVTKANIPKWRDIYVSNLKLIGAEGYEDRQEQIVEAIEESKRVLDYLGEALL